MSRYGIDNFTMSDAGIDYSSVNSRFGDSQNNAGGFVLDSFTYTPFVDYSQTGEGEDGDYDARVGVYSDQFLNDYNSGKYDEDGSVP